MSNSRFHAGFRYNVTVNVGKFAHFSDVYVSGRDTLTLDYYVMPQNLEKAKRAFEQTKPMLKCYERYFGPYPFARDGFKEVESPHLGMEHQSALAYGNQYQNGYLGRASSEVGLKFDFILVHEAAHEWWGNAVTSKDFADMWIHETFGAYAEALYVECLFGYDEAMKYVNGKKWNVLNTSPIIGIYNVNREGSKDMYDKGQLVLNTLRHVIGNDSLWFAIVKGLSTEFRYRTVTAEDIFGFINKNSGTDYTYFFDQYFRNARIPVLEVVLTKQGSDVTMRYRWQADVKEFRMPVSVTTSGNTFETIAPTTEWKSMKLNTIDPDEFRMAVDKFYVDVKLNKHYLLPR